MNQGPKIKARREIFEWEFRGASDYYATQCLNDVWRHVDELTITITLGNGRLKRLPLFEMSPGGILPFTDDQLTRTFNKHVRSQILAVAAKWYRAIGRIMIHSLMGSKRNGNQNKCPIPAPIIPRIIRSAILSGCTCSDKDYYPWAQVITDLAHVGIKNIVNDTIEVHGNNAVEQFFNERTTAISALREGITCCSHMCQNYESSWHRLQGRCQGFQAKSFGNLEFHACRLLRYALNEKGLMCVSRGDRAFS